MNQVAIVDSDAAGLSASLNAIAEREQHDVRYLAFLSPESMISQLERTPPELILLHHTWSGLAVAQLLERIRAVTTNVRVIVFTGREANVKELIECVRFGVCDYWIKTGSVDAVSWSRQIAHYCSSALFTLENLGRPSGAALGLAKEAEANSGRLSALQAKCNALESDLAAYRGGENKEMRAAIYRVVEYAVLAALFVLVSSQTGPGYGIAFAVLLALFFLFLHQRISSAKLGWQGSSASLEAGKRE